MFIGVNDNAEVEGITVALRKDYECEINQAIDIYIRDLKKRLKENLTKDECFTIVCETVFPKPIIVVSVEPAGDVNAVKSERTAYIRKGAS